MKIARLLFGIVTLPLVCWSVNAQQVMPDGSTRPTIAVVLAGGGAKGAAHIGVLQALEEMHIPVDIVTGTSMGSYVGGLYALGMSAEEIEETVQSIDWNSGYHDRVGRSERRVRDKEYDDRYQLHTDLGLRWLEVKMPKGVVQGQNMLQILRQSTGNLPPFDSFDELPVHYRAVATDIVNLKPVVMGDGEIVDAMMASMSVPGALPPYQYKGMLLVDGGVTDNMPVELARSMGADVVIAVDISTDYQTEDQLKTFLNVGNQLSNYLVRRSTQAQSDLLTPNDVLLHPAVGKMSTTDFSQMPEAYDKGYQAAVEQKPQLQRYSISADNYESYQLAKLAKRKQFKRGPELEIKQVHVENNSHYHENVLLNRLGIKPGEQYTSEEIELKIRDLYALDRFERVSYSYKDNKDGTTDLNIQVNEKEWGPNYVDFRFFMEDNFKSSSKYSIGLTSNFTDIGSLGAELRSNVEIGTDKLFGLELYVPFTYNQNYFISAASTYSDEKSNFFIPDANNPNQDSEGSTQLTDTENSLPIDYKKWIGDLSIGYQPTLWQEIRLGIRYTNGNTSLTGLPSFGDSDYTRQGAYVRYRLDTLDDFSFPSKGYYADVEYLYSSDKYDGESSEIASEINTNFMIAKSYQKHSLVGRFEYSVVDTESEGVPIDPLELGGFLHLSGIPRDSLLGRNKAYTSLVYRYKWFENDFGLFRSPVYLGASLEYGGVWTNSDSNWNSDSMYVAGSAFTGVDSPIGPIILAYGQTEQGFNSAYLIIGSTF
ncbi:patatin-like phospholipase family protein [Vibrio sp. CK2-1]|uniref:patatin-like phospholipase family protein n=1 Tax=Vibrio sp. CK2-1 TaxID=2912249 RepID=UPI001F02C3FC|nr:patatin-like phospholipase family protein [Vibrio sp. CK2-1]MCF7355159.1 patatin-like phospholipase family protein [Vibrio sp. CK2-1]